MTAQAQRQQLRRQFRQARRDLSLEQQHLASERIVAQFTGLSLQAKCIAIYLSNDGEVDLTQLATHSWANQCVTTLPVIHPFTGKHLLFQTYQPNTEMAENRFGIAEPALNSTQIQLLQHHDAILLPLVGFDAQGNRLGMGGGFYDRTLCSIDLNDKHRPTLIGIAHDCQQAAALPIQSWDIPLDIIITPTKVIQPMCDNALK